MGKSNEISQDIRTRIVDFHKFCSFFDYNFPMPEGAMFICSNNYTHNIKYSVISINTMGMSGRYIAQEGDGFCVP